MSKEIKIELSFTKEEMENFLLYNYPKNYHWKNSVKKDVMVYGNDIVVEDIKKEFFINTRHFDNIELIEDYSYNVVDNFEDKSIDFIYIDGEHDYESVKKDIELYLPKLKDSGIIGGHDFSTQWPGVRRAVNETLGIPNHVYGDHSWLKYKNRLL